MSDRRLQVYQTDQLRVTYDPAICRHSNVCVRTLPAVFDSQRTDWIHPANAGVDAVIAAVAKCPSGALRAQLVTSVIRIVPPGEAP